MVVAAGVVSVIEHDTSTMMIRYPATTVEEFQAKFVLKDGKITPIVGQSKLKTLLHAHQQLRACVINCKPRLGQFGYLYLIEHKAVYDTYSNHWYNEPANPGVVPDLMNLIMVGKIENAKNIWAREKQIHDNHKNCNTALITVFKEALDSDIITYVITDVDATTDCTFLKIFMRCMTKYGRANPQDVTDNKEQMKVE